MNEKEQAYRMKLTSFFNNEYAYRHLETNLDHEKTLADVKLIKQTLKYILVGNYNECVPDYILDYHLFSMFEREECEIFRDLLNKRCSNYILDYLTKTQPLDNLYSRAIMDSKFKMAIDNITNLSFRYGIYVTHIDSFRKKNYSIENLQESKIDTMLSKLFYRQRTIRNLSHADVFVADPGMNKADYKCDDIRSERLAFYIDLHSKNFNFESVMSMVKAVIALYIFEDQNHQSKNDFSVTSHYIQSFFEKGLHKVVKSQISNKLAGLLMWDHVNIDKMNKVEAVKHLSSTFCVKQKTRLKFPCPGKECTKDDCFRQYCTLFDIADTSILKGRIATAAELETQAKHTTSTNIKPLNIETIQSIIDATDLIGSRLKKIRKYCNMTQKVLAAAIDVPQGHISEYESNKRPIPAAKAALLAQVLNTVPEHFLSRSGN